MKNRGVAVALWLFSVPGLAQVPLVEVGDPVPGGGHVTRVLAFTVNDAGDWLAHIETDLPNPQIDDAILGPNGVYLREGLPLSTPVGSSLRAFRSITLNNSGRSGWNFDLAGVEADSDEGLYLDVSLIKQKGQLVNLPLLPSSARYSQFISAKITDGNDILFSGAIQDVPGGVMRRGLVLLDLDERGVLQEERLIARQNIHLPGQRRNTRSVSSNPKSFDVNDAGDVLFAAGLWGETGEYIVCFNEEVVAQEQTASPVPNRNWQVLAGAVVALNDNRDYAIRGMLGGNNLNDLLIVKNQEKVVQEGDVLPDTAPAYINWFSFSLKLPNTGEVFWYGTFRPADEATDAALFVDQSILLQEGVATVEGALIANIVGDGFETSPNGRYIGFLAQLEDGSDGLYLLDRGPVAHQEVRVGSGVNPICLSSPAPPRLGTTWTGIIDSSIYDDPLASLLFAVEDPLDAGVVTQLGELLYSPTSTPVFVLVEQATGHDVVEYPIPNAIGLIGKSVHAQALVLDTLFAGQFCNAIHPTIGP